MPAAPSALRGEIWQADLNPVRGHEQAGRRPVLIVSVDAFNQSRADLAVIIPITSTLRPIPFHIVIEAPEPASSSQPRYCSHQHPVPFRFG